MKGQCDEFSKDILNIIKLRSYNEWSKYFQPIDELIKIMHWTDDSSSRNILQPFQDSLYENMNKNAEALRDTFTKRGLDFNEVKYIDCEMEQGDYIKIRFMVDSTIDSFTIAVFDWPKTYIAMPLEYHNKMDNGLSAFPLIEQQTNYIPDLTEVEKRIAENYLKQYLKQNNVSYSNYVLVNSHIVQNISFVNFVVLIDDNKSIYVLVNIKTGECIEI